MKDFTLNKQALTHLRNAHRRERNKRRADRLKAVYLMGSGWTIQSVSEALLIDRDSVKNYVERYKAKGILGLLKDDYKVNEGRLSASEMRALDLHLSEHVYRTVKEIVHYVEQEFDEKYTVAGMTKLLHRLGYRYKKPSPIPGKNNQTEQRKFIDKYLKIKSEMQPEDSMFFMDGVHPQHNTYITRGWIKRGDKKVIKTNTRYHRLNINGAIDIDTKEVIVSFTKKLNEESTLDFLDSVRKKRPKGWIYLVLDNAGYYDTFKVKEYAESMAIKLLFLPPYSPNLNLIERLWKYFQANALHNKYFDTFDKFTKTCKDFFKNIRHHKSALDSLLTENFDVV